MTPHEHAELLVMLCGSKKEALALVHHELSERAVLRKELKRLRAENDVRGKDRDYDVRSDCNGYAVALDHIEEFLERGKP